MANQGTEELRPKMGERGHGVGKMGVEMVGMDIVRVQPAHLTWRAVQRRDEQTNGVRQTHTRCAAAGCPRS